MRALSSQGRGRSLQDPDRRRPASRRAVDRVFRSIRRRGAWTAPRRRSRSQPRSPRRLGAPLDVFLVRKLGVPGHAELAMGAIADGGVAVLTSGSIRAARHPPRRSSNRSPSRERRELERRDRRYRGDRPPPVVRGPHRHPGRRRPGHRARRWRRRRSRCGERDPARDRRRGAGRRARDVRAARPVADASSARRRPSGSAPSGSGTRTSRRRPTRKCASCWPRPGAQPAGTRRPRSARRLRVEVDPARRGPLSGTRTTTTR